jgi:hypothetical protein
LWFKLSALLLTVVLVACWAKLPETGSPGGAGFGTPKPPALFADWPKPDVVLVLSGQGHGYLQPCGCSHPQYGGFERRYTFLQSLRDRGWPVVAADLGDIPQHDGPQKLLKYKISMQALKLLNYSAVGIGQYEMDLPLFEALGEYALNDPSPRVLAANLEQKKENFADSVASWELAGGKDGTPRVAIVGIVAPSVAKRVKDPAVHFDANGTVLPAVLKELEPQKPELLVLLYQGSLDEAKVCAKTFPQFRVILCLSKEDEPPSKPDLVGDSMIVTVGYKSRYVGVVGVNRTGQRDRPFELHYQLVSIGPEFETPPDKLASNPIVGLMESYTKDVRKGNYLAMYGQRPHTVQLDFPAAKYVGSGTCKACHEDAYRIWKASPHAHAYQTLVDARKPSLRQYDGECVVCHVVGFGYKSGFTDEQRTPNLKNVGCESCHGPCSLHVENPDDMKVREAINPLKAKLVQGKPEDRKAVDNRISDSCIKCHDTDNSHDYSFEKYWPRIAHPTPKE